MNDNQNAFVTRSTSRVLSVPGGKSSVGFLFGGGPVAAPAPSAAEKAEKEVLAKEAAVVVAAAEEKKVPEELKEVVTTDDVSSDATPIVHNDAMSEAARIKQKNESQHFSIFGTKTDTQATKQSSNAFASAATTNSYNVLTDRPTSRVLRPPGGQSSIKLG